MTFTNLLKPFGFCRRSLVREMRPTCADQSSLAEDDDGEKSGARSARAIIAQSVGSFACLDLDVGWRHFSAPALGHFSPCSSCSPSLSNLISPLGEECFSKQQQQQHPRRPADLLCSGEQIQPRAAGPLESPPRRILRRARSDFLQARAAKLESEGLSVEVELCGPIEGGKVGGDDCACLGRGKAVASWLLELAARATANDSLRRQASGRRAH